MKILSLAIVILLLPSVAYAQVIRVGIQEVLKTEVLGLEYNSLIENGEPLKVSFELSNTGSVGFRARVRLDIFNQSNLLQTVWSGEENFPPGTGYRFNVYYPIHSEGKFKAKVRVYFANEIEEIKSFDFHVKKVIVPEKSFDIMSFRTYKEEVEFMLKSNKTLENVLIVPVCPTGWVCEQKKLDRIKGNETKKITLFYEPSLWKESGITINVFTEDGKYGMTEAFMMRRVGILRQFLHDFSKLFGYFSIFL
ncbi:MAG: hypothetical protein QMD36_03940 [Candidatus Aenigmarchaeota archaeon]|nr:hypothetical protein [Candidatus Aenigmarchaeota archaeon]